MFIIDALQYTNLKRPRKHRFCNLMYIQGVPELSEHTLLREYRYCGVTVDAAVNKLFLKYPLKAKAKCHILPRSGHELFQSPVSVSGG